MASGACWRPCKAFFWAWLSAIIGNLGFCSVFGDVLARRCLSTPAGRISDKAVGSGVR